MATALPQRPAAHQLADESVRFFRNCLPPAWTCDEPQNDYGIDLRIGLASRGVVSGQTLVVQLKSTAAAAAGESIALRLQVATLNYLRNLLEVVMLVKYVAAEQEAYWLLLKDVPPLIKAQRSIIVRVPRTNRLSEKPWDAIGEHVSKVHLRKLKANVQSA